ncbi:MAG: YqgE/AlgH family protein, partial [Magnetococcales bacterium]|nr:YqgE/AlgH family protein [Magnetococcales bacterium]
MPSLKDPNFERAVLFVCSHSSDGALGLVINQPHSVSLDEIIQQLGMTWRRADAQPQVFQGGPVALDRGFILYEQ